MKTIEILLENNLILLMGSVLIAMSLIVFFASRYQKKRREKISKTEKVEEIFNTSALEVEKEEVLSYIFEEAKVGDGNIICFDTGLIEINFKTKKNHIYFCSCKGIFDWEFGDQGNLVLQLEFSQTPCILGEGMVKGLEVKETLDSIPFKTNFYTNNWEAQYQGKRFRLKVWETKQE